MDTNAIRLLIDKYYQQHFSHYMEMGHLPNDIQNEGEYYYVTHIEKDGEETKRSKLITLIPPTAFTQ